MAVSTAEFDRLRERLAEWEQGSSAALESIRVHTWHAKENAHAAILTALLGSSGRYADPLSLTRAYAQVYSQHYEDGILGEILSRLGPGTRTFLEIGVEDGRQNTTRLLLEQGWRGIWIEADAAKAAEARRIFARYVASEALVVVTLAATVENIGAALDQVRAPDLFDVMTIDVDQNTSHLWRAISRRSRIACIEYNASLPPSVALEVPYDPAGRWDGSNWYGASLKTLELIGRGKGMSLVGCDLQGVNAFFVQADLATPRCFSAPFTAEHHFETPRYSLLAHVGHLPSRDARCWVEPPESGSGRTRG